MSIATLATRLGVPVTVMRATTARGNVNTRDMTYSALKTVRFYVADNGTAFAFAMESPESFRNISVFMPTKEDVTLEDRLVIASQTYRIDSIKNPGFRTTGPLSYLVVTATLDEKLA